MTCVSTSLVLRLLLEAELELAAIVYWDALFWQDRLKQ
jgi:hypothetical protein